MNQDAIAGVLLYAVFVFAFWYQWRKRRANSPKVLTSSLLSKSNHSVVILNLPSNIEKITFIKIAQSGSKKISSLKTYTVQSPMFWRLKEGMRGIILEPGMYYFAEVAVEIPNLKHNSGRNHYRTFKYPLSQHQQSATTMQAPIGAFVVEPDTISYLGSFQISLASASSIGKVGKYRQLAKDLFNPELVFTRSTSDLSSAKNYLNSISPNCTKPIKRPIYYHPESIVKIKEKVE